MGRGPAAEPAFPNTIEFICGRDDIALEQGGAMSDLIFLALGTGFFAAAIAYTFACERF
jgi:hypothetical protein